MIPVNELRLGNVVTLNGRRYVVGEIGEPGKYDDVNVHLKGFASGADYDTSMKVYRSSGDLMPIRLTKQMLLEKGFNETENNVFELNGFKVKTEEDFASEFIFGNTHLYDQQYIHQFQNKFKDFTGEDAIETEQPDETANS